MKRKVYWRFIHRKTDRNERKSVYDDIELLELEKQRFSKFSVFYKNSLESYIFELQAKM